jgi:cytochrome c oxidase subunit 4
MTTEESQVHIDEVHHHPTATTYLKVATVLGLLTLVEVGVYYIESLGPLIPVILLALSATKFVTVVMFYMHLKFDGRLMQVLFTGPFLIATFLMLTLMALFYQFFGFYHAAAAGH